MISRALIDTGFMFAVLDESDTLHKSCAEIFLNEENALLPEVALTELAFLILRERKYESLAEFLRQIEADEIKLISAEAGDLSRTAEILEQYSDSKIDFVDAVVMAIAERLDIRRILTVDRRDFGMFRPRHCEFFEIVP